MGENRKFFICGSDRFAAETEAVLEMTLDMASEEHGIGRVVIGGSNGVFDSAVSSWAEQRGIEVETMNFGDRFARGNAILNRDKVPMFVANADPVLVRCAKKLSEGNVDCILTIPGPDGRLGSSANKMALLAKMVQIDVIDGEALFKDVAENIDALRLLESQVMALVNADKIDPATPSSDPSAPMAKSMAI